MLSVKISDGEFYKIRYFYLHISHTYYALNYNFHMKYYFYKLTLQYSTVLRKSNVYSYICYTNHFKVNESATASDKIN